MLHVRNCKRANPEIHNPQFPRNTHGLITSHTTVKDLFVTLSDEYYVRNLNCSSVLTCVFLISYDLSFILIFL